MSDKTLEEIEAEEADDEKVGEPRKAASISAELCGALKWSELRKKGAKTLKDRRDGKEKPISLPWGNLSSALNGGLWPGELTVLVGGSGSGKTQLALQASLHAAKQGVPVYYIAAELVTAAITARVESLDICTLEEARKGPVHFSDLLYGREEMPPVRKEMEDLPLYVITRDGDPKSREHWTSSNLERTVKTLRDENPKGPILFVIDYLQQIPGSGAEATLEERRLLKAISNNIVSAVRSHNVTALGLSTTARSNYAELKSDSKSSRPGKSESFGEGNAERYQGTGKESGDIEASVDTLLVLGYGSPSKEDARRIIGIAKSRNGPAGGWVHLSYDGSVFREPEEEKRQTSTEKEVEQMLKAAKEK